MTLYITKTKKISQEWNSIRSSNLDHSVLRVILHPGSQSICTQRLFTYRTRGWQKSYILLFLQLDARSTSDLSYYSVQFQIRLCKAQWFSSFIKRYRVRRHGNYYMDATPMNQVLPTVNYMYVHNAFLCESERNYCLCLSAPMYRSNF
jgi:hypothetical protein